MYQEAGRIVKDFERKRQTNVRIYSMHKAITIRCHGGSSHRVSIIEDILYIHTTTTMISISTTAVHIILREARVELYDLHSRDVRLEYLPEHKLS
jgi:hypothetical protein